MVCKRCGEELPPDQEKYCPYCGLHKGAFTAPRSTIPQKPKKNTAQRTVLLSMFSVGLVVAIIFIVIPILREYNKNLLLSEIETRYNFLKEHFDQFSEEYTEEDQRNQILFFEAEVSKFRSAYPADEENLAMVQAWLYEFTGVPPDGSDVSPNPTGTDSPQTVWEDYLIENAKGSVIDVSNIAVRPSNSSKTCGLEVSLVNRAEKDITQIVLSFRAMDKSGKEMTVIDQDGKSQPFDKVLYSNNIAAGAQTEKVFLSVWPNEDVHSAKLIYLIITYADGSTAYLPERVCSELWG